MKPNINEALNFLDNYAPEELARLRKEHPSKLAKQVLMPNHAGVTDPALEIRGKAMQAALKNLAKTSVHALSIALKKTRTVERLEDWASVITALGAFATAFTAVSSINDTSLKIGVASFTFLASLVTILAKQGQRSLFAKDISEHTKTLANAQDSAASYLRDLDIYLSPKTPATYDKKVSAIIDDADKLFRTVNLALIELGLERVDA